ncbi:MAG: hypothetical protein WC570_00485 [Patescibacteria group bacterium]
MLLSDVGREKYLAKKAEKRRKKEEEKRRKEEEKRRTDKQKNGNGKKFTDLGAYGLWRGDLLEVPPNNN